MAESFEAQRRRKPRFFDTDFLVQRGLSRTVAHLCAEVAKAEDVVLDYGCGEMPFRTYFERRACHYVGADFFEGADLVLGHDGKLPCEDGRFNGVVSFQVLEHVADLDLYLSEVRRSLKRNGWLMLSTHGTWLYHPHPADYRRWTRSGLKADIEARGFVVGATYSVLGPLAWTTVLRATGFAYALRKLPLLGPLLANILASVMNARAVVEEAVTPEAIRADNACVYVVLCRPAEGRA